MKNGLIILVLACFAVAGNAQTAKKPVSQWESNLSLGYLNNQPVETPPPNWVDNTNRHFAIVKSFWFYPFQPRLVSFGLSFDYVSNSFPISLNIALNLPSKVLVPFVCAGAGFSFSGSTLQSYGGGLKLRVRGRLGFIAEYRHYTIHQNFKLGGPMEEGQKFDQESDYFGAGIAYLYEP